MRRIDARTVELDSAAERTAHRLFEDLLEVGSNIPDAVERVKADYPDLSPEFYDWLSK